MRDSRRNGIALFAGCSTDTVGVGPPVIASGTTPKIITRESYARSVGYGAMCLESLVAIMALIAACTDSRNCSRFGSCVSGSQ